MDSVKQASVAIQDASVGLMQHIENIDNDPEQINIIEERLQAIEGLKRKYGGSIESIFSFKKDAENQLESLSGLDEKIKNLEDEKSLFVFEYQKLADQLHISRVEKAKVLSKKIEFEMAQLNMAGSTFEIKITTKHNPESLITFNEERILFGPKAVSYTHLTLPTILRV